MDPTIKHIIPRDSFGEVKLDGFSTDDSFYQISMYSNDVRDQIPALLQKKIYVADGIPASEYITPTIKRSITKIKKGYSKYDPSTWNRLRKEANPFELHGTSIFINRAAIKLANIDAIYGLTPNFSYNYVDQHHYGEVEGIPTGKWTFADVAGGPGSFSQYLLFRMPSAVGYGITLSDPSDPSLGWDPSVAKNFSVVSSETTPQSIVANQLNVIVGDDGTGDLLKHASYFGKRVLELNGEGVDLLVADGAIGGNEENPKQEIDNAGLIISELITVLLTVKYGGKFVCKIFEAETKLTAQLIYFMSLFFEFVDICKPMSSRPANSERYLIGLNRVPCSLDASFPGYLQKVLNQINSSNKRVTRIISDELPTDFTIWLTRKNDIHANLQITIGHYIEELAKGNKIIPKFNMYKAYNLWNIPDNQSEGYHVVRKAKTYYKYNMDKVEEVDNEIYKEIHRYLFVRKIIQDVADKMSKFFNRGHTNTFSASKFLSMYLLDHLTDNKHHALDPVFPSGIFLEDKRYFEYLKHLSNNAVDSNQSREWFLSLKIKDTMNYYANKIATFGSSKLRYNITKEVTTKGVKYTFNAKDKDKKIEYTITTIMDVKLNKLLSQAYQTRSKEYIFLLLLRYFGTLNSGNHQLGIPDYDTIRPLFNVKEELFASPFNCSITDGYHSAFPDTDKYFGSLGKFSDTIPQSGYGYSVNPPYTDIVMQLAMEKVIYWLSTIKDLTFYITIPVWRADYQKELGIDLQNIYDDYPALTLLEKSGFIKSIRTFHKDTFQYKDWNTNALINASNTHIIIAANHDLTPEQISYMELR